MRFFITSYNLGIVLFFTFLFMFISVWPSGTVYSKETAIYYGSPTVQTMLNRLWAATGTHRQQPTLKIVKTSIISARTDGNEIMVTTGMISATGGGDKLAAVIGHEIGHIALGHVFRNQEMNADLYGVKLANKAGYNGCAVRGFMAYMAKRFPSDGVHPAWSLRNQNLNSICGG